MLNIGTSSCLLNIGTISYYTFIYNIINNINILFCSRNNLSIVINIKKLSISWFPLSWTESSTLFGLNASTLSMINLKKRTCFFFNFSSINLCFYFEFNLESILDSNLKAIYRLFAGKDDKVYIKKYFLVLSFFYTSLHNHRILTIFTPQKFLGDQFQ